MTEVTCAVCGVLIRNFPNKPCSSCETPHHIDCWQSIGGCSIPGCKNSTKQIVTRSGSEIEIRENFSFLQKLGAGVWRKSVSLTKWITFPIFHPLMTLDNIGAAGFKVMETIFDLGYYFIVAEFCPPSVQKEVFKDIKDQDGLLLGTLFGEIFTLIIISWWFSPINTGLFVLSMYWVVFQFGVRKWWGQDDSTPCLPVYLTPFAFAGMITNMIIFFLSLPVKGIKALADHGEQSLLEAETIRRKDEQQERR